MERIDQSTREDMAFDWPLKGGKYIKWGGEIYQYGGGNISIRGGKYINMGGGRIYLPLLK